MTEYRDANLARKLSRYIKDLAGEREIVLMEVCGTHTMAIFRHGLAKLLPPNIHILSGPGCPVCVTPNEYLDKAIAYGRMDNVILVTFGDMMKVPGSSSSLLREKAAGRDIRVVYSAMDALTIARENPGAKVVFFGVGFETTAPTVAAAVMEAGRNGLNNFFILSAHKLIPPALKALVESEADSGPSPCGLHGLICPGHVSAITGSGIYEFLARDSGIACVISGFEALDILESIAMLIEQVRAGKPRIEIQYHRVVTPEGNPRAMELLWKVFDRTDAAWRGLGTIPESGLKLRPAYSKFDIESTVPVTINLPEDNPAEERGCICGEILRGRRRPPECPLYRRVCTPENPIGACMVSSEGTCAAYYKYSGEEAG